MANLTPEQQHKNMSYIRTDNTSIEILLRKALWREGIHYRKNLKSLPGKPDIVITKYKIAIFCDVEFWHGKNWDITKKNIKSNRDYWISKIERNIIRDNKNYKKLTNMGWVVLRFWGNEINKNLEDCVNEIKETIYEIKNGIYGDEDNNRIDFLVAEDKQAYGIEDD
jgi:DNA mismatch endonuclease (patch repair protein)